MLFRIWWPNALALTRGATHRSLGSPEPLPRRRRVQRLVGPRPASLFDPGGKLCERRFLRQASGNGADARRNPIWEGDFFGHVTSRTRVNLAHLRKVI